MTVVRSIDIDAPAPVVWELLTVFRYWPVWGPSVSGVQSDSERVGPGVSGRVLTPVGVSVPFEITSFEEAVSWGWSVAGVRSTGHRIDRTTDSSCRVSFSVPGWFAPYAVVLQLGLWKLAQMASSADSLGTPDVDGDAV